LGEGKKTTITIGSLTKVLVVGWRERLCNICGLCKGETQNF
jgi:hypothetical protein